jgi:hypothetical protein
VLLTRAQADRWLGAGCGHVGVPVKRSVGASLLWLNERAALDDPEFQRLGRDRLRFGDYLLAQCAWQVAEPGEVAGGVGHADRYGGSGIGHNGGSGRALNLNGYNIKGVGRTPLVSASTSRSHAAGGAYLEEAVRETIFAEIVAQSFPHSAVPTLALIDLGEVQDWHSEWSPSKERRVLIVRPAFLRPAHFERAVGFVAEDPREARRDSERVAAMFATLDDLPARFEQLWRRWAEQLAHGFVFQLSHGNNTSSNIALDGRLLDFGAATALPSWARVASTRWPQGVHEHFADLAAVIRSLGYHLGRHVDPACGSAEAVEAQVRRAGRHYEHSLCHALLRRVGLDDSSPDPAAAQRLWIQLRRALAHFDAECLDMLEHTPTPRRAMGWQGFWSSTGAPHWQELRAELAAPLAPHQLPSAMPDENAWRGLCFPELKRALFTALDASERDGPAPTQAAVTAVISNHVALGLRWLNPRPAAAPAADPAPAP